jgi:hypothetical protein
MEFETSQCTLRASYHVVINLRHDTVHLDEPKVSDQTLG